MSLTVMERDFYNDIRQIRKKMKDCSQIDWEQRRYEIAKKLYPSSIEGLRGNVIAAAKEAVGLADALIEELKRTSHDTHD